MTSNVHVGTVASGQTAPGSPRDRQRRRTRDEIRALARAQLEAGGAEAVSLSGIARELGVSAPALYRYFRGRDALLSALIEEAYGDLADALAAAAAGRRSPATRFRAVAAAYRAWALANPRRYGLAFAQRPPGYREPEALAAVAHRGMVVFLAALGALGPADDDVPGRLDRQLRAWAAARPGTPDVPASALWLGVVAWSRLHGLVALELLGTYAQMGIDPAPLYAHEVEALLTAAKGG